MIDPPVELDPRVEVSLVAHAADLARLAQHVGQKALAAEARIDGHDDDDVAKMKHVIDETGWARGIERHTGLLAEAPDLAQHAMQVDGRRRLRLDHDAVGTTFDEIGDEMLRLDDHQVQVEVLRGRLADRRYDPRSEGDVGNEAAVHDIDVQPIRTRLIDGAHLLAEASEICGQYRRSDENLLGVHRR